MEEDSHWNFHIFYGAIIISKRSLWCDIHVDTLKCHLTWHMNTSNGRLGKESNLIGVRKFIGQCWESLDRTIS